MFIDLEIHLDILTLFLNSKFTSQVMKNGFGYGTLMAKKLL